MKVLRSLVLGLVLTGAALVAFASEIPWDERRSGASFMGEGTRAMQEDDAANPGMLAALDGETLWRKKDGAAQNSCADCHGDAAESMRGVASRYPRFDAARGRPIDLEDKIEESRTERQQAAPFPFESYELLALTAYIARQSRGAKIAIADDAQTHPFIEAGRQIFERRQGQLNLSCASCHDDNWGHALAGAPIPQAHPTGYPLYRLEWQALGSLQRRLRNCLFGMRAEPYPYGALENVELELFLMWRARGMVMEAPGVRP
jgi:sulfur-oxidizing protein SoxA